MLVREVMTPEVMVVYKHTSFEDVVALLVSHKISGVPVVDAQNNVIGIVSEKDILSELFPTQEEFYKDPHYYLNFERIVAEASTLKNFTAKDFMSDTVHWVSPSDHILKACAMLLAHKIRRLPVLSDRKLVGIVTTRGIYGRFLKNVVLQNNVQQE